jgi:FKBP-type peptidyl-prolyl cis-trans isomerase
VLFAGASALAAGALVRQANPGFDYRTVPPPHAETEEELRTRGIGLTEAIEIAERETGGGVAAAAAYIRREAPLDAIRVLVHHDFGTATRFILDADTGTVLERIEVPRLPGDPVQGELIDGPDGVRWYVLAEGAGDPPPTDDSNVQIEYTGWLLDGTQFDASMDIGRPLTLPLSTFLPGWSAGMRDMRPGERRKLIIGPEGAFGGMGNPPAIPPNATLVIDVTLLKVVDYVSVPKTLPGWPVEGPSTERGDGLQWWDLDAGDPEGEAIPNLDAIVELHLTGYLTDGTVFTRTRDEAGNGSPIRIDLRRWLTGPAEGLIGLAPGARRKLIVPAALAYGSTGRRMVPPRATVIFDIEVLGLVDR